MSPEATKDFRKLDGTVQKRIAALVTKIEATTNPRFSGKALKGNDKEWRYRLVCEIWDRELIVWLVRVGHRREVYR
jgi:mRNA interferase RelE/StbE